MNKVIITRPVMGICGMQVCAESDVTDEEILAVCNRDNPSGTTNGWSSVIRKEMDGNIFRDKDSIPVQCTDDSSRRHFIVLC